MSIEAYSIAVKIALSENVSAGILSMSRHFADAQKNVDELQNKIDKLKKSAMLGGAIAGAGIVGFKGLEAMVKSAAELNKAEADFATLNLSKSDNALVKTQALSNAHSVLGTTIAGNIKQIQDLHTVFGSLDHAINYSGKFAQFEAAAKMSFGDSEDVTRKAAKALEHRGSRVTGDEEEFNDELKRLARVKWGSKNMVNENTFTQASMTGGIAYSLLDKDYLYGKGAAHMSISSGDRFGTMTSTAFSSLVGGHMDSKAKGFLAELGMYDEGISKKRMKIMHEAMKKLSPEEQGTYLENVGGQALMSGGLKSEYLDTYVKTPDKFEQILASKIREKYGAAISNEKVADIIASNFNKNTSKFLGEGIVQDSKFEKDAKIFNNSMDYVQAYKNYADTMDGANAALSASFTNLKSVLGDQLLPVVESIAKKITSGFDSATLFVEKHPDAAKAIMLGAGALATIATAGGSLMIVMTAIKGFNLFREFVGLKGVADIAKTAFGGLSLQLIGKAGLAGAAIWATYKLGELGFAIKGFWDVMHREGVSLTASASARLSNPAVQAQLRQFDKDFSGRDSQFVRPSAGSPTVVHTQLNMDGRKVASLVSMHQGREAARPLVSGSQFDSNMNLLSPSFGK